MCLALIVVPDPTALPGKHCADRQQPRHLSGLEDAPLRIDEWEALAAELEPIAEISAIEKTAAEGGTTHHMIKGRLA